MLIASIAVFSTASHLQAKAQLLAERLSLPYVTEFTTKYNYLLVLTPEYLGLQNTTKKSNPLFIDFLSGKMQYRRQHASLRKEILARALGLKSKAPKKIVDATTGLARDSFILAALGFEVTSLERSPIIFALIEDALERATQDSVIAPIVKRIHLVQANALEWLKAPAIRPEIIYLDPMFPERKKSALSKQDMRIFHEVIGNDPDADELLKTALTCATERVVVKRPRLAPALAELTPTLTMEGSSNRFDIYLTRDTHGPYSSTN